MHNNNLKQQSEEVGSMSKKQVTVLYKSINNTSQSLKEMIQSINYRQNHLIQPSQSQNVSVRESVQNQTQTQTQNNS